MPAARHTDAAVWLSPAREEDRFLPEGPRPVVVDGRDAVAWVNIQIGVDATGGEVHVRFWDTHERRFFALPKRPGFLLPTSRPGFVLLGLEKEVGFFDLARGFWQPLAAITDPDPRVIINDGEPVPGGGAVVFGTKDVRFAEPIAHLYMYTLADNRVTRIVDGMTCSNGKVFLPDADAAVLLDIDTPTKVVRRYRINVAEHTAALDGVALDLTGEAAFPDGMVGCGDDTVIVAYYDPTPAGHGRAVRYKLGSGEVVEEWRTPGSPRVTCPMLVQRPDGVRLLLTTATEGMPADQRAACPQAGSLFLAETRFRTAPPQQVLQVG